MAIPLAIGAAFKAASVFDVLGGPSVLSGLPSLSSSSSATSYSSATQEVSQATGDFSPNFGGSPAQLASASLVPILIVGGLFIAGLAFLKGGRK